MSGHVGTPDCFKFNLVFEVGSTSEELIMTFYGKDATGNAFSDPEGFNSQAHLAASTNLLPQLFDTIRLVAGEFEDVRSVPFGGVKNLYSPGAGTKAGTGTPLPNDVSIAVGRTTGTLGRSGRGRLYWPILRADGLSADNVVDSAYTTAIAAALTAFQADVEAGTYPCSVGIVSYQSGGTVLTSGVFRRITAWGVSDNFVDSQRRRLPGRGR